MGNAIFLNTFKWGIMWGTTCDSLNGFPHIEAAKLPP